MKGNKMILQIFTIRDEKAEFYSKPFFSKTHGEAERTFQTAVNDPKTQFNQHPEDFDLYHVGEYDDQTGKVNSNETPKHIIKAVDLIARATNACAQ